MRPSSSVYKTSLKITVRYKGLKDEIEQMSTLVSAHRKRSQADESEEEDVVPPTPPKQKAHNNSEAVSVPAAVNTLTASLNTSTEALKASAVPSKTSSAPSKTSNPAPVASTSQLSEPSTKASDEDHSDGDESSYPMAADFFEEKHPKTNRYKWPC